MRQINGVHQTVLKIALTVIMVGSVMKILATASVPLDLLGPTAKMVFYFEVQCFFAKYNFFVKYKQYNCTHNNNINYIYTMLHQQDIFVHFSFHF